MRDPEGPQTNLFMLEVPCSRPLLIIHSSLWYKSKNRTICFSLIFKYKKYKSIIIEMGFPTDATTTKIVDKYQGVVIAQIACTLILYIVLRIIHYCMWGHALQAKTEDTEAKQAAEADERKWDQDSWDIYFPIIFANHIVALSLPILYTPSIFVCVLAFIHFALFAALVIVNVFTKDGQPGAGTKTSVSRIIWGLMCLVNVVLFITGLAGIRAVLNGLLTTA